MNDQFKGLEDNISKGAVYNSAERGTDAPTCHPDTRKALQADILSWIGGRHDANLPKFLWLSGPAGSGKTAIAGSISDQCRARRWLAASFFFSASSGGTDRRSKRYLIPTLAYHLYHQKPCILGLQDAIISAIAENPSVFESLLDMQLDILILEPLRKVGAIDWTMWPKVVVIDGLDECRADPKRSFDAEEDRRISMEQDHEEILSVLQKASLDPVFPFRILLASRPERVISKHFSYIPTHATKKIFLDEHHNPEADIELFVQASLETIGHDRGLQENWYPEGAARLIAQEASGQFIYATTALRFVKSPARPPHEQLERVLRWRRFNDPNPFAALDALYTGILEANGVVSLAVKWLLAIDTMRDEAHNRYMWSLLESYSGDTQRVLGGLTSLICLDPFRFYHKSFLDFLQDPRRSGSLHVSVPEVDKFLGDRYYQVLKSTFRVTVHMNTPLIPSAVDRGCQSTTEDAKDFLRLYCQLSPHTFDLHREYEQTHVEWWMSSFTRTSHDDGSLDSLPLVMLAAMHQEVCGI